MESGQVGRNAAQFYGKRLTFQPGGRLFILSTAARRVGNSSLRRHQSVYLGFVVGRSVAASAVEHNHTISGIYLHRGGENILDLAAGHLLELFGNISDSTFDGTQNFGPLPTGASWGAGNDFYLLPGGCGRFEENLLSQPL